MLLCGIILFIVTGTFWLLLMGLWFCERFFFEIVVDQRHTLPTITIGSVNRNYEWDNWKNITGWFKMHSIDYFLFIHFFMFDVGTTYDD